jgi:hypothetical protein
MWPIQHTKCRGLIATDNRRLHSFSESIFKKVFKRVLKMTSSAIRRVIFFPPLMCIINHEKAAENSRKTRNSAWKSDDPLHCACHFHRTSKCSASPSLRISGSSRVRRNRHQEDWGILVCMTTIPLSCAQPPQQHVQQQLGGRSQELQKGGENSRITLKPPPLTWACRPPIASGCSEPHFLRKLR